MFCRRCGTKNPEGDAFCSNCGAPLGASGAPISTPPAVGPACPQCGTPAASGQPFCRRCGAALPVAGVTPAVGAGPPPTGPVAVPARARPKRGCLSSCLLGCFIVILVSLGLGVAGYVAFRTGALTTAKLLNLVGLGPADIETDNFRDDTIQVSILQLDAAKGTAPTVLKIKRFNIRTYHAANRGRFRVTFSAATGGALGTCTLTVRSGDHYQFVTLASKIVINRVNRPASVGTDFVVATSTLCR